MQPNEIFQALMDEAYQNAIDHGFPPLDVPSTIALIHAELSEGLESDRKGEPHLFYFGDALHELRIPFLENLDVGNVKPEGLGAEYADVIIRILSDCKARGIDIYKAIRLKMNYNKSRPYKHGGKKI